MHLCVIGGVMSCFQGASKLAVDRLTIATCHSNTSFLSWYGYLLNHITCSRLVDLRLKLFKMILQCWLLSHISLLFVCAMWFINRAVIILLHFLAVATNKTITICPFVCWKYSMLYRSVLLQSFLIYWGVYLKLK